MIRVTVSEIEGERRSVEFDRLPIRIGRDPANDLVLHDAYVSSRHGELREENGSVVFEDFCTTNGSLLRRGERLSVLGERNLFRATVCDEDELLLGDASKPVRIQVRCSQSAIARRPLGVPAGLAELDVTHAPTMGEMPGRFDREALLALHRLATEVSGRLDLDDLLEAVSKALLDVFRKANHVSVWLGDDDGFHSAISQGRDGGSRPRPVSRMVRDRVLAEGKALAFTDAEHGFDGSQSLHDSSVRAGLCAPLWDGRSVIGLVQVDCRGTLSTRFDQRDLEVLVVFAHQTAMAINNARLHEDLRRTCEQSIRGLVRALEAKDRYTYGHSEAVAELCERVARRAGLDRRECDTLRRAALLHDIGKIGIPYAVLNKEGRLSAEEFRILRTHPEVGARILEPFDFLAALVPIVLHHHERWDGRGYPEGLSGEDIPRGARILAVVDTYHALTSDRAYRAGIPEGLALDELRRCAGTQFDPAVIDVLIAEIRASGPAPADDSNGLAGASGSAGRRDATVDGEREAGSGTGKRAAPIGCR